MAGTVTLDAGANRVSAADGAETDFKYQGNASTSIKGTAAGPIIIGGAVNYNTSPVKVWLAKALVTNKDVLTGNGVTLRIGSTNSANYYYYAQTFTANTYPIIGGWQIVPIDPTMNAYGRNTTGTPNLGSIIFYQVFANLSATSKSENIAIDAVDYVSYGSGLTVTGSGSLFSDFVAWDEGTYTNRYGMVTTREGILYIFGQLTIGTSTLTTMTENNRIIVFPDGRFNTGFSGLKFGLENASNNIALSACTFIGRGQVGGYGGTGGSADTRPTWETSGTSGVMTIDGCSLQNFNTIVLNSKVTVTGSSFIGCKSLTKGGASLTDCAFDRPSVATGEAFITVTNDLASIQQCDFISSGTGHAINITTAGEYAFVKNTFTGYATDAGTAGNRAILNSSNGNVIINIDTGDTPSVYNTGTSTTTVNNTITLTLTGIKSGSDVRILDHGTTTVRGSDEDNQTGTYAFGYSDAGSYVDIVVHHEDYLYYRVDNYQLPGSSGSLPINQQRDRQYLNP